MSIIKKHIIKIIVALFVIISLILFHKEFYQQFNCYLTGQANIVNQAWHIVALNIVLFLLLLLPLSFRRKANWGSSRPLEDVTPSLLKKLFGWGRGEYGLITAFFVSLFIEMYGFPLTIYFASRYFTAPVQCAEFVLTFYFWGINFGMELAMIYTSILIFIGTLLIIVGWVTLYKNSRKEKFITSGIYKYSRHPQYLGFILIVFGWLIDWPTLITIIFAPLLIYKYIRVCKIEEKEILLEHPEYQEYLKRVPFFF